MNETRLERYVDGALWAFAGLVALLIVVLSLGTAPEPTAFSFEDKVFHALFYMVLAFAVLLAGVWRPGRGTGAVAVLMPWLLIGVVGLGLALEGLQVLVHRNASVADALADLAGVLAALALWRGLRRLSPPAP
jgi:VanZ family protein